MAKGQTKLEFMVEDLIIEGILAGVFRTCDQVELTPFGEWLVEPFQEELDPVTAGEVVAAVFRRSGKNVLDDTEFLRGFMGMALEPRDDEPKLVKLLDAPPVCQKVLSALGAASIQFALFLCLCGVYCKWVAVRHRHLGLQKGDLVYGEKKSAGNRRR